jgi:hypothetical protein
MSLVKVRATRLERVRSFCNGMAACSLDDFLTVMIASPFRYRILYCSTPESIEVVLDGSMDVGYKDIGH